MTLPIGSLSAQRFRYPTMFAAGIDYREKTKLIISILLPVVEAGSQYYI